jgi:tetratricopeptide (TPR) repeat protein
MHGKKVVITVLAAGLTLVLFAVSCATTQQADPQSAPSAPVAAAKPQPPAPAPQPAKPQPPAVTKAPPEAAQEDTLLAFAEQLQNTLESGSVKEALLLFENMNAEYATSRDTRILYASLLLSDNQLANAKVVANELIAANPKDTEALILASVIAKASGDNTQKRALINKVLSIEPNNSDANVELANEQMLRKNYQLARRYYLTAVKGNPKNPEALSGAGQAAYFLGEYKDSEEAFNTMLKLNPTESVAWSYLGKLAAEKNNFKKAQEYV